MSKPWQHTSPSQIKTFMACNAMWWWEKIQGHRSPPTAATIRGGKVHSELEDAKTKGVPPEDGVALAILEHVGSEMVDPLLVEGGFNVLFPGWPVPVKGFIDLQEPHLNQITDYKTTSDFKYARTPEELKVDPQGVIYPSVAILKFGFSKDRPIRFRHIYGRTRGSAKTMETVVEFTDVELEQELAKLGEIVQAQARIAAIVDLAQVPKQGVEKHLCHSYYGRACPHLQRCTHGQSHPDWFTASRSKPSSPSTMSRSSTVSATKFVRRRRRKKAAPAQQKAAPAQQKAAPAQQKAAPALDPTDNTTFEHPIVAAAIQDGVPEDQLEALRVALKTWGVGSTCRIKPRGVDKPGPIKTIKIIEPSAAGVTVEMVTGEMAFAHQLVPADAVEPQANASEDEGTASDPLTQGINPPDGVGEQDAVPVPVTRRALRVPASIAKELGLYGKDGQPKLVSQLKKSESMAARTALLPRLGFSDTPKVWGKVGEATKIRASHYKEDVTALVLELNRRGPAVPGQEPEQPTPPITAQATVDGMTYDVVVQSSDPVKTEVRSEQPVTQSEQPVTQVARPMSKVRGAAEATERDMWLKDRPLLIWARAVPRGLMGMEAMTIARPYMDAAAERLGEPSILVVKDYQTTGFMMAAASMQQAIETGALKLPSVIVLDPALLGAQAIGAVLARYCATIR